jgi:hypothetical protein
MEAMTQVQVNPHLELLEDINFKNKVENFSIKI